VKGRRIVSAKEQKQRGCPWCLYAKPARGQLDDARTEKYERRIYCAFDKCPYHVLDGIKDYITEYDRPIARRMPKIFAGEN
jgi:hypothetical protein